MITIRSEQFEAFQRMAQQSFEDELVAHLHEFSPKHAAGVGEEGLRRLILSGLQNARLHGFRLRGPLRFFVECQVMFGHEFPTDPLIPWGGREFGKQHGADELARADAIHKIAMAWRNQVVGVDEEIEAAAIKRLLARPAKDWLAGDPSEKATAQLIAQVYPEKVARIPYSAVTQLINRGKQAAAATGLPLMPGTRVLTALMVAFGHGVLTDPQFPWVARYLDQTASQPPKKRVEGLAIRAMAYLSDGQPNMKRR